MAVHTPLFTDNRFFLYAQTFHQNLADQGYLNPTQRVRATKPLPQRLEADGRPQKKADQKAALAAKKTQQATAAILSPQEIQQIAYHFETMDRTSLQSLSKIFQSPFENNTLDAQKALMIQSGLSDFMETDAFGSYLTPQESSAYGTSALRSFLSGLDDPSAQLLDPLLESGALRKEDRRNFEEAYGALAAIYKGTGDERTAADTVFAAALSQQQRSYMNEDFWGDPTPLSQGIAGLRALQNTLGSVKDSPLVLPTTAAPSRWDLPTDEFLSDPLHGAVYQSLRTHLLRTPLSQLPQSENTLYAHRLLSSLGASLGKGGFGLQVEI